MKKVTNKLQVRHYAQVPCEPFCVDVADETQAKLIQDALAKQHLFLFTQGIIPDYSNIVCVVMWDDSIDNSTGEPYGWIDYYNAEENMEWNEFEETYFKI